jgi:hypothetical protein
VVTAGAGRTPDGPVSQYGRLGDVAGPGGSQSLAETLASPLQELERGGEGALRGGALRASVVLFDEACLKSRSNFTGRLERLIEGPFPRHVVHHGRVEQPPRIDTTCGRTPA